MFKRKSKSAKAAKPKRAKKAKPAKARGGMAVAVKKQPLDIYTVMLIISFLAVFTAVIILWRELSTYGSYPWWKAQ